MKDIETRLTNCFQTVFPGLSTADILTASQETLASWDSVATLTLVTVIEEEFLIEMDFDALADLNTFDRIREYLEKEVAKGHEPA